MERCYTHDGPCANWSVLFVSTWPAVNMDTSSFEVILAHSLSIRPKRRRNFTFCPPWLQKTSCGVYGLLRRRDHLLSSKLNHTYLLTYLRTYVLTYLLRSCQVSCFFCGGISLKLLRSDHLSVRARYWCVGYSVSFPFIKHEAFSGLSEKDVGLYKNMFAPDLQRQTLAIIGCASPVGPHLPLFEMQSRIAVKVFKVRYQQQKRKLTISAVACSTCSCC